MYFLSENDCKYVDSKDSVIMPMNKRTYGVGQTNA